MEYELDKTRLEGYEAVLATSLTREETLEMIVPDACPDILRVVETDGRVQLTGRTATAGRVELTGSFQLTVLYLPDGESGLRHLEVAIPFAWEADGEGVGPDCVVTALPRLRGADTRAVNPRKVLVRAQGGVDLTVYASRVQVITGSVAEDLVDQVEQLTERRELSVTPCVQEKPFSCEDDISLPAGKPPCAELLKYRVGLSRGESKIIGNKLIFKGAATLSFLYRGEDGALCTAGAELPFSQIMEVMGVGEEAQCDLTLIQTGGSCAVDREDPRTLSVAVDVLAQAVIRESRVVPVLSDAYSVREPLECRWESCPAEGQLDSGLRSQNVREIWETEHTVREVTDCRLSVGEVTQDREGERLTLKAQCEVWVLYLGEDGEPYGERHGLEVACPMELGEGLDCLCRCEGVGDIYATPAAMGLEARFALDFRYLTFLREEISSVSSLTPGQAPEETGERPSLVLRALERGERLWDVAKSCGTTVADIMGCNELEEESQATGRLLLIPRKR